VRERQAERPPRVVLVSYLFPPANVSAVRRVVALRDGFHRLGIETSVLTSAVTGRAPRDDDNAVFRAADIRAWWARAGFIGESTHLRPVADIRRHPLSRLVVPDLTAASWAPAAALHAASIARRRTADGVFTTSPPESVHLVGAVFRLFGVHWIADLRDGWTFEPPTLRPFAASLDRRLEEALLGRADCVTAVTPPLARALHGRLRRRTRVVHLSNGYDATLIERATDERRTLDPRRFSLVYTGSGKVDGKDLRPFFAALRSLVRQRPGLRELLEVLVAGNLTAEEVAAVRDPTLDGMARWLGHIEHLRALGLQQAADGLLLITSPDATHVATGKIFEYLAARKPILALADRNAAVDLLSASGPHVVATPADDDAIGSALKQYVELWIDGRKPYVPHPEFPLAEYSFDHLSRRLADLFVEAGAFEVGGTEE
jgi:hypothetical protein